MSYLIDFFLSLFLVYIAKNLAIYLTIKSFGRTQIMHIKWTLILVLVTWLGTNAKSIVDKNAIDGDDGLDPSSAENEVRMLRTLKRKSSNLLKKSRYQTFHRSLSERNVPSKSLVCYDTLEQLVVWLTNSTATR
jgi:hypothetical protein